MSVAAQLAGLQAALSPQLVRPESELEVLRTTNEQGQACNWVLGRGFFGTVYKARWHSPQGPVEIALKVLGVQAGQGRAVTPAITWSSLAAMQQRELQVLRDCNCPHIVQFLGACVFRERTAIMTELMAGGSLFEVLRTRGVQPWPWPVKIALDIASGISYLHHNKTLWLDVKSPNVLLTADLQHAKIADMGLARVLTGSSLGSRDSKGTYHWAAPELLLGTRVTRAADVWSFGVVLWEVFTAQHPHRGKLHSTGVGAVDALIAACHLEPPEKRPCIDLIVQELLLLQVSPQPLGLPVSLSGRSTASVRCPGPDSSRVNPPLAADPPPSAVYFNSGRAGPGTGSADGAGCWQPNPFANAFAAASGPASDSCEAPQQQACSEQQPAPGEQPQAERASHTRPRSSSLSGRLSWPFRPTQKARLT